MEVGTVLGYDQKFLYDNSGRLIFESKQIEHHEKADTFERLHYLYDDMGVVGLVYDVGELSNTYYLQRNLLGDVVAIYDVNGTKVGAYTYDAWGNCTITYSTKSIVSRNPIRYRGYYYDSDMNLYHLGARYYSPEWRRFISPDDTEYLNSETANGLNLYTYCNNDPVNFSDPSGHFTLFTLLISVGVSLLFEAADDYINGGFGDGSHDWKDYAGAAVSGALGSMGGNVITQAATSLVGGLADAVLSGDLRENGFSNTVGNIAISSAVSWGAGKIAKGVASIAKAYSLKSLAQNMGNNAANQQLSSIGVIVKMGSNAVKKHTSVLFKPIFKSHWAANDILDTLFGSIAGGVLSVFGH